MFYFTFHEKSQKIFENFLEILVEILLYISFSSLYFFLYKFYTSNLVFCRFLSFENLSLSDFVP